MRLAAVAYERSTGGERRTLLIIRWHRIHYPGRGTNGPGSSRNSLIQIPLGTLAPFVLSRLLAPSPPCKTRLIIGRTGGKERHVGRVLLLPLFYLHRFSSIHSTHSNDSSFPRFLQPYFRAGRKFLYIVENRRIFISIYETVNETFLSSSSSLQCMEERI